MHKNNQNPQVRIPCPSRDDGEGEIVAGFAMPIRQSRFTH